jgi:hypothetical protein
VIYEYEEGGACRKHEQMRNTGIVVKKLEGRDHILDE